MSDNPHEVSDVPKSKTVSKKRDDKDNGKTEKPILRKSERLNKPKSVEPEKLQHCAIRNENSKSSGMSRKVRGTSKKPNESEAIKPVPSKATYTGNKNLNNNDSLKQNQKNKKENCQKVYPRKLGNSTASKTTEKNNVVPHENILTAVTTQSEASRKIKKERVNEETVNVESVIEKEEEQISIEKEIDIVPEVVESPVQKPVKNELESSDQNEEISISQEMSKKKGKLEKNNPPEPQTEVAETVSKQTECQDDGLEDGEISEENDLFYIDRTPKIECDVVQKEVKKPQKQVKVERTIKEIIDEACKSDEPDPSKHTEYRRMFLPRAFTSYLDENSILRLFGRCDPLFTCCHYDAKGVMIGSGVIRIHNSKEKLAVEHSKDQVWEAKRLLRVSQQKPECDSMEMYIYKIPINENTATIVHSLREQYEAKNIQLFYKVSGEFTGCCRASMTYENAVKLTRNRTYTLKNKTYSIFAFQIEP